jgi:hypothetical protein
MTNSETLNRLAIGYIRSKGVMPNGLEYKIFTNWVLLNFARIQDKVIFSADEVPPEKLISTYEKTGSLLVSAAHNYHPHWLPVVNLKFRAVHDYHHVKSGAGFDLEGEFKTYEMARKSAPIEIDWILYSEIVLQTAATLKLGEFCRQKLVRL